MLKRIFTVFVFITLCSTIFIAQSSLNIEKSGGYARLQAMGSNPYIIDPLNMTINPAWGS